MMPTVKPGISATTSTLLELLQSTRNNATTLTASASQNDAFGAILQQSLATLCAQSPTNSVARQAGSATSNSSIASLLDFPVSLTNSTATVGLTANGRNATLFDPEAAYAMMTRINTLDVTYKAQFAELSAMRDNVSSLQQAAQTLADEVTQNSNGQAIGTRLQAFADQYNAWVREYSGSVLSGGLLDGTQAAQVSLYELRQSLTNPFNGAAYGIHGLPDIGLTVDAASGLVSVDSTRLNDALANNRTGVVDTIDAFSANFAQSAGLLNSADNFLPDRLANLDRAIVTIDQNLTSWQAEFGLGDRPQISSEVAQALATYRAV